MLLVTPMHSQETDLIPILFRFIYDRSGEESSRAREIERSMREARFRELCKVGAFHS